MDKEQAKRVRQFMRDSGIKHYIYGIGTLAGAKKAENLYFKTDEEFNQKAEEILSDKWNVEIYVMSTEQTPISNCGKATLISPPSTSRSSSD